VRKSKRRSTQAKQTKQFQETGSRHNQHQQDKECEKKNKGRQNQILNCFNNCATLAQRNP